MPRITVEWLEGRSQEQKNQLAKKITDAFVEIVMVKPEQVTIVFRENKHTNQFKGAIPYQPVNL